MLTALVLAALVSGAPGLPAHAQPATHPAVRAVGVDERPGASLPLDLVFTDSTSRSVRLGDSFGDGKPVLLLLTYTRCAMLCSLVLRGTGQALARLDTQPGSDFRVVNVSIDPRETPHEAARKQAVLLEQIGAPGEPQRWPFLVGKEAAIRALAASLGFRYAWDARTEQYAHPAVIFVIDPHGRVARYLYGFEFDPRELTAALAQARLGATAAPGALASHARDDQDPGALASILSCFRFESTTQIFGASIRSLFQGGALLILGTLATAMALFLRHERRRRRADARHRAHREEVS
jgi:protein SCO1/2